MLVSMLWDFSGGGSEDEDLFRVALLDRTTFFSRGCFSALPMFLVFIPMDMRDGLREVG